MRPTSPDDDPAGAWARSGAMWLSGRTDGPGLGPPAPLVPALTESAARLARRSAALGEAVRLDPLAVLTERAAIRGLRRQGRVSCGGASRLLPTADGWLALTLARPDDIDLLPAWLGVEPVDRADPWDPVAGVVGDRSAADLVAAGATLGLPVAEVGADGGGPAVMATEVGAAPPRDLDGVTVVDLSALWAGPLCGRILRDAGARVVKVESSSRPDGARRGPAAFFDLMNAGKESVAVDFRTGGGRDALAALVAAADVVVEASRPRALEALGIDACAAVAEGPAVWVSITAHGRRGPGRDRVGFGDDAAAGAGLVVDDGDGPCFCADAVADPVTGMTAALAVLDALHDGGRWLLDVAMVRAAAELAGPTLDAAHVAAVPPSLPPSRGQAAPLGADTAGVLGAIGR